MTPRFQKKLIFLRYPKNRLLKAIRAEGGKARKGGGEISDDALLNDLLGGNAIANMQRWMKNPDQPRSFQFSGWSRSICAKLGLDARPDLFDDDVRSYEFGELLGLSRKACKYLVDANFTERHEMIASSAYDANYASTVAKAYAGIYELILDAPTAARIYVCALQIRYYLPINSSRSVSQEFRIRCKVSSDANHEGDTIHDQKVVEYDGYLSNQPNHLFFVFESRDAGDRRMLTLSFGGESLKINGKGYMVGDYLRSEPLRDASRRGGIALLHRVDKETRLISPETDLTTVEDNPIYERQMSDIPDSVAYADLSRQMRTALSKLNLATGRRTAHQKK